MRNTLRTILALALLLSALPAAAADFQIINGQPASEGEYPAMAAIRDVEFGQFCGGTLVDPEWVLTAAHCFYDARTGGSNTPPEALEIVLDSTDHTVGGERLGVSLIVIHPAYDDLRTVNDVALLQLATPATTPPAALVGADGGALYTPGTTAIATGYGVTNSGEPSEILLEVEVPLVSDADCEGFYADVFVADRHTCAGELRTDGQPGADSCQGDSGGPLFTDPGDGTLALIGITSFGEGCGGQPPGVYAEVITFLDWIAGTIDGSIPPNTPTDPTVPSLPDGAFTEPLRIATDAAVTDPVALALEVSRVSFLDGQAQYGVIATATQFPDALGGSSLAYGIAPLLFSGPEGVLREEVLAELQRVVTPGAEILVLGGIAAVPAAVDDQLREVGFIPRRLAGDGREATAAVVAREIFGTFGSLPADSVIVATGSNWPDAVTVGDIGSFWGIPILLTPTGQPLNADTAAVLRDLGPSTVLLAGGEAALSAATAAEIEAITGPGSVQRLGGSTRFGTAAALTDYNMGELYGAFGPRYLVAVNLRREADAFAHVLAGSMITGQFGGVYVPVEGEGGDSVPTEVQDAVCALDLPVVVIGGTDLVTDAAVAAVQEASAGINCDDTAELEVGEALYGSVSDSLPLRKYTFQGVADQFVTIRADAIAGEEGSIDPVVRVYGPDGALVAENDDSPEGGLNSLVDLTLPADGTYTINVERVGGLSGAFLVSLDPEALFRDFATLSAEQPVASYPLDAPAGTRVVVEMRALPDDSTTDPVLFAYDAQGNEIAFDDDGGAFPNARMSFLAPGGPIEVIATVFGDFYGDYELSVFAPDGGVTFG